MSQQCMIFTVEFLQEVHVLYESKSMKKLYQIAQQGQMSGCLADDSSRSTVNSKNSGETALMRRLA